MTFFLYPVPSLNFRKCFSSTVMVIPLIASNYLDTKKFFATKFVVLVQYSSFNKIFFIIFSKGGSSTHFQGGVIRRTKGIATFLSIVNILKRKKGNVRERKWGERKGEEGRENRQPQSRDRDTDTDADRDRDQSCSQPYLTRISEGWRS